jgi:hypothetical protein
MKAATGEFNSMPNKERKLVQLPSGYHFVGHAAWKILMFTHSIQLGACINFGNYYTHLKSIHPEELSYTDLCAVERRR